MSHKIGVVGDRASIMAFKMIGLETRFANSEKEARNHIQQMANEDFGLIYVTEELAELIPETIKRYDSQLTPALILIPNHNGSKGIALKRLDESVEKAVGQNIL